MEKKKEFTTVCNARLAGFEGFCPSEKNRNHSL